MKDTLKHELICDWSTWLAAFDVFVKGMPRDNNEKMWAAKDSRDYCTWKVEDGNLYTISYRYVHVLTPNGDMHCLQPLTENKVTALDNYNKLYNYTQSCMLPILVECETVNVGHTKFCYTKFASPNNELGTPPAYNLINIMKNSENVVDDFSRYIKELVDSHCWLIKESNVLGLPLYKNNHALVNHFTDAKNLYFKDTLFDYVTSDTNLTKEYVNQLVEVWAGAFDGFWRAQGIVSVYRSRPDCTEHGVEQLHTTILNLIKYAETQCLKLMN